MLVLYVSFLTLIDGDKELVFLELFAGTGRLTRLARSLGYRAEGHDVVYDSFAKNHGGNNAMDITGEAGYLLLGEYCKETFWINEDTRTTVVAIVLIII